MDTNSQSWHTEVISEEAERVLAILLKNDIGSFYLAGGTALALRLGHRLSRDFDFFNSQPFDEEILLNELKDVGNIND